MTYNPYEEAANANLQRYLRQLSYFDQSIPRPPLDGIFEAATEEALRAYQRSAGLPETGIADAQTWERLYADYVSSLDDNSPPAPIYIFPRHPQGYAIVEGAEGFIVLAAQYLLNEMLTAYGEDEMLASQNGIFDSDTVAATKRFQQLHRLSEDGKIDRITWNHLAAAHRPTVERFPRE